MLKRKKIEKVHSESKYFDSTLGVWQYQAKIKFTKLPSAIYCPAVHGDPCPGNIWKEDDDDETSVHK